ncbi:hypothetical protein HDU85_001010 [Gaertneriomyces sp. JEL0708]|nr:hypothetical protein HDU85_001010 [Gaertneriomyces sp. JEL0708]
MSGNEKNIAGQGQGSAYPSAPPPYTAPHQPPHTVQPAAATTATGGASGSSSAGYVQQHQRQQQAEYVVVDEYTPLFGGEQLRVAPYANRQVYAAAGDTQVPYEVRQGVVYVSDRHPVRMWCPFDQQYVITSVTRMPGMTAWCSSILLCIICWPFFWVPFLCRGCQDKVHRCTRCGNVLAIVPA